METPSTAKPKPPSKPRERKPADPNAPKRTKKKKPAEGEAATPGDAAASTPGGEAPKKKRAPSKKRKQPDAAGTPGDPNSVTSPTGPAPPKKSKASGSSKKKAEPAPTQDQGKEEEKKEEEEEEDDESLLDEEFSGSVDPSDDVAKSREIVSSLTPEQESRYEMYRRSSFTRSNIKKIMQAVAGPNAVINQKMAIVMGGVAKIFVGEIVESARSMMDEAGESGPVRPRHIREAYRVLKQKGKVPYANNEKKSLFRH
eukprot:TRINITY_DN1505_c0_g1_i1.p1 TRINITY_DN1505_c0_g1~~TRINITY_DN1505_c0_g1_i1.p1  ORF type:complete len:256 (+),score=72.18 TRINITY_DN1505_c0_g1_i1:12-779(+)